MVLGKNIKVISDISGMDSMTQLWHAYEMASLFHTGEVVCLVFYIFVTLT